TQTLGRPPAGGQAALHLPADRQTPLGTRLPVGRQVPRPALLFYLFHYKINFIACQFLISYCIFTQFMVKLY
ncbi:MAG: hypothetical protein FWG64_01100, partial [Firmicutes bacterium]|nr:hypothetical protein [Bacillota bacterium]